MRHHHPETLSRRPVVSAALCVAVLASLGFCGAACDQSPHTRLGELTPLERPANARPAPAAPAAPAPPSPVPTAGLKAGWDEETVLAARRGCRASFMEKTRRDFESKVKAKGIDDRPFPEQAVQASVEQFCACVMNVVATRWSAEELNAGQEKIIEQAMQTVILDIKAGTCQIDGPMGDILKKKFGG